MHSSSPYHTVSPEVQQALVAEYQPAVRGHGREALAKKYSLSPATVQHVLKRVAQHEGDPLQPRGHRKRKLRPDETRKLERALDANPLLTNQQLANKVET